MVKNFLMEDIMEIKNISRNEIAGIISSGAGIGEKIFRPVFGILPSFAVNIIRNFSPFEIFLACISRFSFGLFLGSTFPEFFRKHRIKILLVAIMSSLPLLKKVLDEK